MLLQYDFSQVFIWVINPVPNALHVDERDRPVFRTNPDLFDNEPGATVKDGLTRFNVPRLMFDNFHSAPHYPPSLLATPRKENQKQSLETDNPLNGACLDSWRHSIDTSGQSLRSSLPESRLLPVRLAYQQCFCGHCVPFLAELPRFENSQNVKMTISGIFRATCFR